MLSIKRIRGTWPLYATIFALIATDQFLNQMLPYKSPFLQIIEKAAEDARPGIPKLILLASSRGSMVNSDVLVQTLRDKGMPDLDFVRIQAPGGTPSLLWVGLKRYIKLAGPLPEGSRVVYLITAAEFNWLNPAQLSEIDEGIEQ